MPVTVFDKPIFPGAKLVVAELTVTNTSGSYSNTVTDSRIAASMKPYALEIENPAIFNAKITVTAGAGSYTISCSDVAGSTTVKISFLKVLDDPTAVTSTEFDILDGRIGDLTSLTTTAKTSAVAAINEVKSGLGTVSDAIANLLTPVKLTIVKASSNYTVSRGWANRVGKTVIVNIVMTSSVQIAADSELFRLDEANGTNVQVKADNAGNSENVPLVMMFNGVASATGKKTTGGKHYISSSSTIAANTTFNIVGTFLCN